MIVQHNIRHHTAALMHPLTQEHLLQNVKTFHRFVQKRPNYVRIMQLDLALEWLHIVRYDLCGREKNVQEKYNWIQDLSN